MKNSLSGEKKTERTTVDTRHWPLLLTIILMRLIFIPFCTRMLPEAITSTKAFKNLLLYDFFGSQKDLKGRWIKKG